MRILKAIAGAPTGFWFGLTVAMVIFAAGCEPYDLYPEDASDEAADQAAAPETPATPETPAAPEKSTTPETPATPETPVEEPTPPPPVSLARFLWEPRSGSVRIVIPLSIPHWQMNMCTTTPAVNHQVALLGPVYGGGTQTSAGFEYTLDGNGEYWRSRALGIDPKGGGAIVVFINTRDMQPSGYRTSHWIVPNPTQLYSGNPARP